MVGEKYLWVKSTYQKQFTQKIYLGKDLAKQLFIFTSDIFPCPKKRNESFTE